MPLTSFQNRVIAGVKATLAEAGVDEVGERRKRVEFDDGEADEMHVVLSFTLEGDAFELWVYPDEAGVLEPDGEWYDLSPKELDDATDEEALVAAVVEYVNGLFE